MEEALLLLNDGGAPLLAPALQQDIQESLHDLKPQCVLDHLKVSATLLSSAMQQHSAVALHECFLMTIQKCFATLLLTTVPPWEHGVPVLNSAQTLVQCTVTKQSSRGQSLAALLMCILE